MYVLSTVSPEITLDDFVTKLNQLWACELSCDDHLISATLLVHPLANPLFALAKLIVHSCVDN